MYIISGAISDSDDDTEPPQKKEPTLPDVSSDEDENIEDLIRQREDSRDQAGG